ncbi:MAG: cysteine peptidase family C39 domain-containing protein [Candidatus Paceibacterota bacterium]|jgi:hypothetical protein
MGLLKDFPELRQTYNYDCGATALQAVLAYYGIELREDLLMRETKTTEEGTQIPSIIRTAEAHGLHCEAHDMKIEELQEYVNRQIPIIIPLQAWTKRPDNNWKEDQEDGHYAVVIGYDDQKIIFEDPSAFERTYLLYDEFDERWHDVGVDGTRYIHYGIAISGPEVEIDRELPVHMD